jgi:protein required for attachment to host cells
MKPDWILIANASRARLLHRRAGEPLALVRSFEHPESRRKAGELGDDRAGHEVGARGDAGAAYTPRIDAKEKEQLRFARELADVLEHEARLNTFGSLSVFASSPFLGELKRELGGVTAQLLSGAHDVDLTAVGLKDLTARIAQETLR